MIILIALNIQIAYTFYKLYDHTNSSEHPNWLLIIQIIQKISMD